MLEKRENQKNKKLNILFITQWYKPINAPVKRMARIVNYLVDKKKYKVTVLTGMPSYPTGILPRKYKWKFITREKDGKVNIIRTYEYPAVNKGVIKRLLNNISFTISSTISVFFMSRYDIVIISSPSFLSSITGLVAQKLHNAKLIFDIRDLWPDSAIELGFIKKPWLITLLKWFESLIYKKATTILTATPNIFKHLVSENIPKDKLILLLNSVDTNIYKPRKIDRKKFGFDKDDFIFCYTGNHSAVQDLSTSIRAAKLLSRYPRIKFLFVGEGEERENLINMSKKYKLMNTTFWPLKKMGEIINIINMSDVGNISLADIKIFQEAIPTKTSEYLACGKPVAASVRGELKKYLLDYQAGIIYQSGDEKTLSSALLGLHNNHVLRHKMSLNARKLAIEKFSNTTFYKALDSIFY